MKNKVAPPFRVAEFDVMYGTGISYEADVLQTAIKYGVATKTGATYSFDGQKIAVGIDNSVAKLKEDKKMLKEMEKKTKDVAKNVVPVAESGEEPAAEKE